MKNQIQISYIALNIVPDSRLVVAVVYVGESVNNNIIYSHFLWKQKFIVNITEMGPEPIHVTEQEK